MIFNSIRWRLQIWHGVILVAVLAGFGFTAYHVARENQLRRIDQELEQEIRPMLRPPPPPPRHSEPAAPEPGFAGPSDAPPPFPGRFDFNRTNTFYYVLWRGDGTLQAKSPGAPDALTNPPPRLTPVEVEPREEVLAGAPPRPPFRFPARVSARTRDENREVYRFLPNGECLLVGRSMAADIAAMRRLEVGLVMAGAAVLTIGLAGGWWLATRAIRPIEEISATAERIAAGDLSQRMNVSDTESELGRLAGVLNSTFARLETAFEQQARFTSDASHELRTPLAVLLSQVQTALSRDRSAAEYKEALEACQRAAQRMRVLAESLLELARLDAEPQRERREPFDLSRLTQESAELVQPLTVACGINVHCSNMSAVECEGDPERIARVITNLLTNAVQYNREGGEVRVSTSTSGSWAVLEVKDTGVGIAADQLPRIFERFYRADASRSGSDGHAGLGLAICQAIVRNHGGSIEVSSQPGVGSVFTVKLPRKGVAV